TVDPAETDSSAWPVPDLQVGNDLGTHRPDNTTSDHQPVDKPSLPSRSAPARPPLPVRQPQQHLADELRDDSAAGWEPIEPARSPEETRARFARYQRGWQAGRAEDNVETPTGNGQDRKA